jgi:hypothetical protein
LSLAGSEPSAWQVRQEDAAASASPQEARAAEPESADSPVDPGIESAHDGVETEPNPVAAAEETDSRRANVAEPPRKSPVVAVEPADSAVESVAETRLTAAESGARPPAAAGDRATAVRGSAFSILKEPRFLALVGAVAWAAGVCAYTVGYQGWGAFDFTPFRMIVLVLLAFAPIPLLFGAAQLLKRSTELSLETRRAWSLSQSMGGPTALAAAQTADVIKSLREEIAHATAAAERARSELSTLNDALSLQTRELEATCNHAATSARVTVESLGRERDLMGALAQGLDKQAAAVVDSIERQARMVRDASDLAQTQLREAEAALAARAADLAAAAGEAQDAARLASDDLARQTLRLETAGTGVAEQIRSVEEGLSQQRAALVQGAYQLRADQEDFAVQVETQRAQMIEVLSAARSASGDLGEASGRGAEAMRELIQAATQHFRELGEATEGERNGYEARVREGLERFAAFAATVREQTIEATSQSLTLLTAATEEARRAADAAAAAARVRVDGLGEAAFEAGRRADEAFEARMTAARRLIEDSTAMVEAASAKASARLESDFSALNSTLAQVESALSEIDGRAARLPEEAKARIEEIRAAVEKGLETMSAAARKAAEETEAADAGFHARVKRNYDMLSEAVRMMNAVAGEPPPSARVAPAPTIAEEARLDASQDMGLRGKLRLTRHAADSEVRNVFEAPAAKSETEGWTWRDLLGGLDPEARGGPHEDGLAAKLVDEVKSLGVDPHALLPRARVEEAAAAWLKGDADSARHVVRRVAPAAVRRISRRVITDKALRGLAERYISRYAALVGAEGVSEAAANDLLGSEAGRTFLLIDAAVGGLDA